MNTAIGNAVEQEIMDEIKRLFPNASLTNKKTHGIDIKMQLWSRNLNIEVKSCQLRTRQSKKYFSYSKFIVREKDLMENDLFYFKIRDVKIMKLVPTSYLKMFLDSRKYTTGKSYTYRTRRGNKYTYISVKEMLSFHFFTLEYFLKHYCNESRCTASCEICPYHRKNDTTFLKLWRLDELERIQ